MPAGARWLAGPAAELQEELAGPVAYSERWLWIALALALLVALYFAVVWWATRPPRVRSVARPGVAVPDVRREHLDRIDAVVARVAAGALSARDGHQQLSAIVRSFLAAVTTLPARTMALADFRSHAPQRVTDTIALMYPPEFAPDDDVARARFEEAVARARELVATWE